MIVGKIDVEVSTTPGSRVFTFSANNVGVAVGCGGVEVEVNAISVAPAVGVEIEAVGRVGAAVQALKPKSQIKSNGRMVLRIRFVIGIRPSVPDNE